MEEEILQKLAEQEIKINQMYESVEKLRKYFLWTLIITGATIVLPIVIFAIAWPLISGGMSTLVGGSLGL